MPANWHKFFRSPGMKEPSIVPTGETGSGSDNTHEISLPDEKTANEFFQAVKQRLLDVNAWHQHAGKGSAVFQLTDEKGNEVQRPARLGDHFMIDIPGPGTVSGKGRDWVQIEAIEHQEAPEGEVLAMRVRPSQHPAKPGEDVAHFFTDEASSTFSVSKSGNRITAAVYGRNEKPNVEAGNLVDKIRNAVVGAGAILGLNKPQWQSLVKGLLKKNQDKGSITSKDDPTPSLL